MDFIEVSAASSIGRDVPGHEITGTAEGTTFSLVCSCGDWSITVDSAKVSVPIESQDWHVVPRGSAILVTLQSMADAGLEHILRVQGLWPQEVRDEKGDFFGFQPRHCGEHRTVGSHRAWCYDENEWCYPGDGCTGCKVDRS